MMISMNTFDAAFRGPAEAWLVLAMYKVHGMNVLSQTDSIVSVFISHIIIICTYCVYTEYILVQFTYSDCLTGELFLKYIPSTY